MMTPEERYGRDPKFHLLVDLLTQQIIECEYTPTELREAAILAAIRYETFHARPKYQMDHPFGSMHRVDSYHGREEPR
jgi:hypothetical protein